MLLHDLPFPSVSVCFWVLLSHAVINYVSFFIDLACIHKCRSDTKCRNYPLSLLPSQFLGMRSLIRYGLESNGFADTFCGAVLMLLKMLILLLTVSFTSIFSCCSQLLYHSCHFLSQLLVECDHICCGDHVCSQFCCCWSWSCYRGLSKVFERFHSERRSADMSNATRQP